MKKALLLIGSAVGLFLIFYYYRYTKHIKSSFPTGLKFATVTRK